ncbi:T9SS type A sorting domain-containing protein [Bacteroidia bacterium]|nr:T9SS type A sorting domain-containing protein [Bacteroidia bacterium]
MNKKLSIGVVLLLISSIGIWRWNKSEGVNVQSQGQHPGWVEHFRELKGDENGEIPKGLAMQWYKADQTNKTRYKKAEDNLENIKEIGPFNVGGRTRSILVDYNNPNRFLCAGVSGGIWISENAGIEWNVLNDYAPTLSATSITQSPFDNDLFYYGTGEAFGNSADLGGLGLFKSEDGAKSFQHLEHTMTTSLTGIWDVEHSLVFDSTIYVATHSGGLWRSTDAAQTFTRIYSTSTRIHEIEVREDGHILIAVNAYGIVDIDETTLVATRMNGGDWPTSGYSRISFDYVRDYPLVMYAQLASSNGFDISSLYKTSNGGVTWNRLTDPPANVSYAQAWYCFKLSTAPRDTNFVISLCVDPTYSSDGGQSWRTMADPHADYHEVTWINDNEFLVGNDAGVNRFNKINMNSFTSLNNGLNITQFYAGHFYPTGNSVIGGTQDNGTRFSNNGIPSFANINGGDGAFCSVNQQDDGIRYVSSQFLNMRRQSPTGTQRISNFIRNEVGGDDGVWFINPFEINNRDGDQIYVPTRNGVFRSTDQGDSWIALTNSVLGESFSVGLSHSENPIAYLGGTASRLYYVNNAATASTGEELPIWEVGNLPANRSFLGGTIGCIEVDPNDETTIYCGFVNIDTDSRIWRIRNANSDSAIFDDIGANLPESVPVNWVEVDPDMSDHILVGTDYGLYTSLNAGQSWQKETRFPNVPIDQIRLRDSDRKLYIYTHGRGIWTADLKNNLVASVKESTKFEIKVYPNPSTDYIQIEGNMETTTVYNSIGNEIIRTSDKQIATTTWQAGTYFLEVRDGDAVSVKKVIVTH